MENNILPTIQPVNEKVNKELLQYFRGETEGYVQVGSKKWFLPVKYEKLAESYKNFEVRSDDVWITGIPRSGTTVTQELAWLLCHGLDYRAAEEDLDERVRYFELDLVFNDKTTDKRIKDFPSDTEHARLVECMRDTLKFLHEDKKRRVMKTHLPFELLPDDILRKGCKVIYVCRQPKDVAVSYYLYEKGSWHLNFTGDFQKYWHFFKNGNCTFGPYFEHVGQGYDKRHLDNVLVVFYEDLRKDLKGYIENIGKFLGRPLTSEDLCGLEHHLRFENFKENSAVSKNLRDADNNEVAFVRKGKVGGWKEHFTVDMNEDADTWIEKNTKKIGIRWPQ